MRTSALLPLLAPALILRAGSPWDAFLERHQGLDPRLARWILCVRPGAYDNGALLQDDLFRRLVLDGDLSLEALGPAEADDFWSRQSWRGPDHWALLTPAGALALAGSGQPRGGPLAQAMRDAGDAPRFEVRAAFLGSHPEQGEALQEEAALQFRLLRSRHRSLEAQGRPEAAPAGRPGAGSRVTLPDTPQGRALAEALFGDAARVLGRLFAVPGWSWAANLVTTQASLWDLSQSPSMRAVFAPAAGAAEALLRQDPHDAALVAFWIEAREAAGLAPAAPGGQFTAAPGRVWPSPAMVGRILEPYRRRQDWEGALRCLTGLVPAAPPEPLTPRGWDDHVRLQCALRVHRGVVLGCLGSWDLAAGALDEARLWGGGQGVREAILSQGAQWTGAEAEPAAWRAFLAQALRAEGPAAPRPEAEPPLRLVVMGNPPWLLAWAGLPQAPDLLPWSPAELRWEAASREVHAQLRRRFGWDPGPRWVLFRGEAPRATGVACPEPRALATILEGESTPAFLSFQRVLEAQPDHRGARRGRFALVLTRMPEPRLEATLARDAAAARLVLPFEPGDPWKPDRDTWAAAAQEVLPRVEEELRSWPGRLDLWEVWISWARFHPRQPSILALAQSLPYWSPREDWRAGLPFPVQRAVAAELRRTGAFDLMRAWFRAAWEALDQRPLAGLRPGEREWVLARRREEETAVFQPLRDALRILGCGQEQMEVERVFGAMMGQDRSRRR